MEKRIKNLERRMDRVEKHIKLTPLSSGKDVKCPKCGYTLKVRSKLEVISCSSCGSKIKNTSLKDGKRN